MITSRKTFAAFLAAAVCLFICSAAVAQPRDRNYIKEQIRYQGACRNVAITRYNGDLMLYGKNGWAASGCPDDLTEALNKLNEDGKYIDDVQLTENGRWLILYGDNGFKWNDIPYSLEKKLREWNEREEVVTSVTFNDAGEWIAVSTEHVCASDSHVQDWIAEGMEDYGSVYTACITDDVKVVVYENGYRFDGDVPDDLMDKLRSTSMDVYRLKIAGSSWFISDGDSTYSYSM